MPADDSTVTTSSSDEESSRGVGNKGAGEKVLEDKSEEYTEAMQQRMSTTLTYR